MRGLGSNKGGSERGKIQDERKWKGRSETGEQKDVERERQRNRGMRKRGRIYRTGKGKRPHPQTVFGGNSE